MSIVWSMNTIWQIAQNVCIFFSYNLRLDCAKNKVFYLLMELNKLFVQWDSLQVGHFLIKSVKCVSQSIGILNWSVDFFFLFFLVLWNLIKTKIILKRRTSEGGTEINWIEMLEVRESFPSKKNIHSLIISNYTTGFVRKNFHWTSYEDWYKNLIWKSWASWTCSAKEREIERKKKKQQ